MKKSEMQAINIELFTVVYELEEAIQRVRELCSQPGVYVITIDDVLQALDGEQ